MTVTDEQTETPEAAPAPAVYITRAELAERLRLTHSAVAHWPARGYGPKARKFGGQVRYKLTEVEAWEDEQELGEDA